MKIKLRQLNEQERTLIVNALLEYSNDHVNTHLLSAEIMNGEVLLGVYQYNEQEKGGEHEDWH